MEDRHRSLIQKNYATLVEKVNLNELLPRLIQKGVFSQKLAEAYQNTSRSEKDRKRDLFIDIQRRGPEAFDNLVSALKEVNNYDHIVLAAHLEGTKLPSVHQKYVQNTLENNQNVTNQVQNNTIVEETEILDNIDTQTRNSGAHPFVLTNSNEKQHRIRQLSQENPQANINLSTEPLIVKVKKSERFLDDPREHKVPVYRMRSKCRGIYLGINNMEFINDVQDPRHGAQVDEENLKDLFKQMGFSTQSYRNQTKMDMLRTIREFTNIEKNPLLRQADCVIITIMSHGEEGYSKEETRVITSDGQWICVSWILDQFSNINCPPLIHKPKIFFFQTCRGSNLTHGVQFSAPSRRIMSDGGGQNTTVRNMTDMLIAFSTLPGDKAYRDIFFGSWYIEFLCKIFMNHAFDTDIEHLLKMVDDELQSRKSEDGNMQTSSYESRGFKLCYLHPGLSE